MSSRTSLTPVPEILGYCDGQEGGSHPDERRLVGGGYDDNRMTYPVLKVLFYELPHLPAPFPDETYHIHLRFGVPCNHAEQDTLSHAGPGKDTHPLPFSAREKAVDASHPQVERLRDSPFLHGVDRIPVDRNCFVAVERPLIVHRVPSPSITRPRRPSPASMFAVLLLESIRDPIPIPLKSPRGMSSVLPLRKPTTSPWMGEGSSRG